MGTGEGECVRVTFEDMGSESGLGGEGRTAVETAVAVGLLPWSVTASLCLHLVLLYNG